MKIPNYSYGKITFWKTNSWKSGERHLAVCQVSPDILKSLTNKHMNTTQENLFGINTDDASKILGMTSWMSHHICKNIRWSQPLWQHPGSHIPKALEVLVGGGWRWGCSDEEDYRKSQEFTSQALLSLSHEKLFSRIVSILTSIFMDCILWTWSCANSRDKGKTLSHGG